MEARLEGYQIAARQAREGKRIAKELDTDQRILLMFILFLAIAAIGLTASWVIP